MGFLRKITVTLLIGLPFIILNTLVSPTLAAPPLKTDNITSTLTFDPLTLSPVLWLDAADAATLAISGTQVISWTDKSGLNFHATAPAIGNSPVYSATDQSIIFDGIDDVLAVNNIDYGPGNAVSVFAVAQADTTDPATGGNGWIVGNGPYSSDGHEFALLFHLKWSWKGYNAVVNGLKNQVDTKGFDTDPHMVGMIYDGSYLVPRLDGKSNSGAAITPLPRDAQIGIGSDPTIPDYSPFEGRVSEVLIFQKALSVCEASLIEAYLADKWGFTLPDEHLLKDKTFAVCPPAGPYSIPEDAANGTSLDTLSVATLQGSVTPQNWQFIPGEYVEYDIFTINPNTGEITITDNSQLDFETAQRHILPVTVSDGTNWAVPVEIIIDVIDVTDGETKQYSQLWGQNGELWDPRGRLPDFSYAGYHSGERAIPTIPVVTNVLDYGAVPDDGQPDHLAIQAAIDATISGTVYLPAGQYIIEQPLFITKSNIVLRGAGHEAGGTNIYSPYNASDIYPYESGFSTGGSGQFIRFNGTGNAYVTDIVEPAWRGDRTITVADGSQVTPGMVVEISWYEADQFGSLWQHLHNDQVEPWPDTSCSWANGNLDWYFKVDRVEGNLITLKEPLPMDIRSEWQHQLKRFRGLEEVGVEDLRVEFPYITPPDHLTEPGYNGIQFSRVINSWMRNVAVHNSDNGLRVTVSGYVTLDNIHITGRKGHHGVSIDYGEYTLLQNLKINTEPATDAWIHGVTFTHKPGANVVATVQGNSPISMDFHRNGPSQNLFTNMTTEWSYGSSGAGCAGPHAAARNTYWNLSGEAGIPQNKVTDSWGDIQTTLVSVLEANLPEKYSANQGWYEDVANIQPANLYQGQLNRRLTLPADPPFSPEPEAGERANWFERDPARWKLIDESGEFVYQLFFGSYANLSGERLGEYSVFGNNISPSQSAAGAAGTTISVRAKTNENLSTNPAADFALILGYQDDENYLYALISSEATQTGIYRIENGTRTTLVANPGFSLSDNDWHDIVFGRYEDRVAVMIDDTEIMAATDTVFTSGQVGVGSYDDRASFDIVRAYTIYFPLVLK